MRTRTLSIAAALLAGVGSLFAAAPTPVEALPTGFADALIATFTQPTAVKVLPGGDLLVLEKQGTLRRVASDGTVTTAGTVNVTNCSGGERGLLSAALDPT